MKYINFMLVGIVLLSVISGCISGTEAPEKTQYAEISVQQAKAMIDGGGVFILDVRTQEEYDAGHINGSVRIPVQDIKVKEELDKELTKIPRDRKILVYCRTGIRSAQASEVLVNNGFTEVYSMKGGITDWTGAGYEVIK
ncbi:MAG: rhodanese-like domain-containing protein [Candidatus Methanoperedens sp.]|nr:rhodanese-like domain-containing protein [Candidatus Methanoperedens sp.]MCZ7370370.1 rhodanese-like domain-containing protein [Candidatus Methanoperedens sp.]